MCLFPFLCLFLLTIFFFQWIIRPWKNMYFFKIYFDLFFISPSHLANIIWIKNRKKAYIKRSPCQINSIVSFTFVFYFPLPANNLKKILGRILNCRAREIERGRLWERKWYGAKRKNILLYCTQIKNNVPYSQSMYVVHMSM